MPERAEIARGLMLELFPEGFEERETADGLELVAYTDSGGEERLWAAFGAVQSEEVVGDWEERWRAFHRPVHVGSLWVGPPWEQPPEEATAVVIEPGRAFGTGGHPTTRLCLELLLELEPGSLLDVGCGSGVIAVAAACLGFGPVAAVDREPAALEARLPERLGLRRGLRAVADTRRVTKADLPENTALPDIRVEPDTFQVWIDGEEIEPRPVAELPLAQRYFLF